MKIQEKFFIVSRASKHGEKPCDEAVEIQIHEFFDIAKHGDMTWYYKLVDVLGEDDNKVHGAMKKPTKAWCCAIHDLYEFVEKYGKIVLSKPNNVEGLWEVLIYDDYIE